MNPSTSVYNFVFMVVTYALAPAVTSLVTAALGKSKPARAGAAIRTALLLSAVGGCVLAAALQAAFPTLLQVMGCGAEAMPAAVAYSVGRGWVRIPVCPGACVRLCRWPFCLANELPRAGASCASLATSHQRVEWKNRGLVRIGYLSTGPFQRTYGTGSSKANKPQVQCLPFSALTGCTKRLSS